MLFIIPEILIVLLIIGLAYLPAQMIANIVVYIIFLLFALPFIDRHADTIDKMVQKIFAKLTFWRRKEQCLKR